MLISLKTIIPFFQFSSSSGAISYETVLKKINSAGRQSRVCSGPFPPCLSKFNGLTIISFLDLILLPFHSKQLLVFCLTFECGSSCSTNLYRPSVFLNYQLSETNHHHRGCFTCKLVLALLRLNYWRDQAKLITREWQCS